MSDKSKMVPPDTDQCQSLKPNGHTFMTLEGRPGYVRCTNKPVWIATEKKANPKDGMVGSMSLCDECKEVFLKQMGKDYAVLSKIE